MYFRVLAQIYSFKDYKMTTVGHLINGEIINNDSRTQDIFNPATGESSKKVALASKQTVEQAIAAAEAAFPQWRNTPPIKRARVMFRFKELLEQNADKIILDKLGIKSSGKSDISIWKNFINKLNNPSKEVKIGFIGKYVELQDAYISIIEAFKHAGVENNCKVEIVKLHSEKLNDDNIAAQLKGLKGILVAPGFGDRGIEGKINAIKYARENNIPFFGICLGMQCAVIEYARNVLNLEGAHSLEMNADTKHPVINLMEDQKDVTSKGGTMRLGAYECSLKENTLAYNIYNKEIIAERHRHRYEFNNKYKQKFENNGMIASGLNLKNDLVEIIEIKDHPYFIGVQFHPEYSSTVAQPHPLFISFIAAALKV